MCECRSSETGAGKLFRMAREAIPGWVRPSEAAKAGGAALGDKPRLLLEPCDPDVTVAKLRDILANTGTLFDRGVPVRLAYDQNAAGDRRAGNDGRPAGNGGAPGMPPL